jgi:exodeoxyribonuclease V alpha subunit
VTDQAEAVPQVPAVYLPPFYQAERSLAHALLRLHAPRADRLSGIAAVDWDTVRGVWCVVSSRVC